MQYDAAVTNSQFATQLKATALNTTTIDAISTLLNLDAETGSVVASTVRGNTFNVIVDEQGNTQTPDVVFYDRLGDAGDNVTVAVPNALSQASTFIFDTTANVTTTIGTATTAEAVVNAAVEGAAPARVVVTGAGNDTVTVNGDVNTLVDVGNGNDTVTTAGGADTVILGGGTNTANTGAGNDVVYVSNGIHTINGGEGFDVVNVNVSIADYTGLSVANGAVSLTSATNGNLNLTNVEFIAGSDNQTISIVSNETEGAALRLFEAVLGRDADVEGAQFYINQVETGISLSTIANNFLNSAEYTGGDVANQTDAQFIESIYQGALGREADNEGLVYWAQQLVTGHTRADVVVGIVGSTESQAHDTGVILVTGQV